MHITYQQLVEKGACAEQLKLFKRRFGPRVNVTKKLCLQHAEVFAWHWAAVKLLNRKQYATFRVLQNRALDDYLDAMQVVNPVRTTMSVAAYKRAYGKLRRQMDKDVALAFWRASKI